MPIDIFHPLGILAGMAETELQRYVRLRRKERPGATTDLAIAVGVSDAQMSRIINRRRGASAEVIMAIADHTGIPAADVLASVVKPKLKSRMR